MYLTLEKKQELFEKHGNQKIKTDTGSPESQIALFTFRINHLTDHLKQHKKDFATQQGLLKLVGKRRRLLNYLSKNDIERYRAIIAELNLRK
ncbi:MAG: 30S ribosomal protein S15 [Ferruginibacter sp.]|nr:30S ribosomal protein S15 [Cytophagales bacterium]